MAGVLPLSPSSTIRVTVTRNGAVTQAAVRAEEVPCAHTRETARRGGGVRRRRRRCPQPRRPGWDWVAWRAARGEHGLGPDPVRPAGDERTDRTPSLLCTSCPPHPPRAPHLPPAAPGAQVPGLQGTGATWGPAPPPCLRAVRGGLHRPSPPRTRLTSPPAGVASPRPSKLLPRSPEQPHRFPPSLTRPPRP